MAALMKGQVCVVTGASRGIGRGIALQLCQAGATVYITGRHLDTLQATAQEAQSRGGRCVPVVCDSSHESEVRRLFEQVDQEQHGRLDVLVNNAYAGVQAIFHNKDLAFWESPASMWDDINDVGLRGHYLCSVYGARLMVPAGRGLIVVISSIGGLQYFFNVPYGVGKAACDRLAVDCAQELRRHGPEELAPRRGAQQPLRSGERQCSWVPPPGPGVRGPTEPKPCSSVCPADPDILSLSGKVLPSCDLARRYHLQDVDGRPVQDYLSVKMLLTQVPSLRWLASYLPGFLRMPKWIMTLYTSKF
ncbi:dehydrogenase/reductase SDR family member 1 [Echinops telfairi]|uniref:Dehydrogenase/reductase SDR family member 1 n=1 Tax=Echinops telfairi TaxID=9371 RepID=A0AC55CVS7_ECHTE|nr:dehydrogenase/reductase SDR family member 1 [Echinops telfairi]